MTKLPPPIKRRAKAVATTAPPSSEETSTPASMEVKTVEEGSSVAATWEKLGVRDGVDPLPLERARFVVSGLVKDGKSTYAASIPNSLVLDYEDSIRNVGGARAHYIPIIHYQQHQEIMKRLEKDAQYRKYTYTHVVFDTLDRYADLEHDQLCSEYDEPTVNDIRGGKGGYKMWAQRVLQSLRDLYKWGYGWTVIVHLKWQQGADPNGKEILYTRKGPIPGIIAGLDQDADYICQVGSEIVVDEVPDPKNPKMKKRVKRRRVLLNTHEAENRGYNSEVGTRIPLSEYLELPLVNGFDVLKEDWNRAVKDLKARDRQLRGG